MNPDILQSFSQGSHNILTLEPLTESSIIFDAEFSCVIFILVMSNYLIIILSML